MKRFRHAIAAMAIAVMASCSAPRQVSVTTAPSAVSSKPVSTGDAYTDYIANYSDMAVRQMEKYGIPASITLAQGILESDAGRSSLAVSCNNHFGIKCHSDWTGRTMRKDDDAKNECFRCYSSASESFEDHSLFLVNGSRYSSLFTLGRTDYKGWARGLKAAGYATSPTYADKLIELVERYGLDRYDTRSSAGRAAVQEPRAVLEVNECRCVVLRQGETLQDIAAEYGIRPAMLRRYNDADRRFTPPAGVNIFLEKKKTRSARDARTHTVKADDSLWSVSQQYGIRLESLIRRNAIGKDNPLKVGMVLLLR